MPEQQPTPAEILARSAFGFALLAFIPLLLAWIAFLFSPISPDPTFASLRTVIIVSGGLLTLLLLAVCALLLRTPMPRVTDWSQRPAALLGRGWLAGVLLFLLLELNLFAFITLGDVAPAFTGPGRLLLLCWSLLLLGIVATLHQRTLAGWLARTRGLWVGLGLFGTTLLIGLLLVLLHTRLLASLGIADALRGGLDYRELVFYGPEAEAPTAQAFWLEQSRTRVSWLPYAYWRVDTFSGSYINVDAAGLRYTPSYVADDAAAPTMFVFGGSTVWGEGARDAYTIPGHIARILDEHGLPARVFNFGQTGYVSMQDMLLFQMQLLQGNMPDVAIFYQGFNDVLSAWGQGLTGLTLQETQRVADVEAGRLLRGGQPLLSPLSPDLNTHVFSLAGITGAAPENIAARWLANMRMVRALAAAYDVHVLFVWQPSIIFKQSLTASEQGIYARTEAERPGLFDLYAAVDALVRAQPAEEDVLILSDLFAEDTRSIFHDLVHITEVGNAEVAEAIVPLLLHYSNIFSFDER